MNIIQVLVNAPSIVITPIMILISLLVYHLINSNSINFKSNNIAFSILKKNKINDEKKIFLLIEKIIEVALEISDLKINKKIKLQMDFTENKISDFLSKSKDLVRTELAKKLDDKNENISQYQSLENHPDMFSYNLSIELIENNLKEEMRTMFRKVFVLNEVENDLNEEEQAEEFSFKILNRITQILNKTYTDFLGNYKRELTREDINKVTSNLHEIILYELRSIYFHIKDVIEEINLQIIEKQKTLEDYIKEFI